MQTYYLLMIDSFKFVIHKQSSNLQVTQQNEGGITNIVAIFKASDNFRHWVSMENFQVDKKLYGKIKEVLFKNPSFTEQGSYQDKINNFLNNK